MRSSIILLVSPSPMKEMDRYFEGWTVLPRDTGHWFEVSMTLLALTRLEGMCHLV